MRHLREKKKFPDSCQDTQLVRDNAGQGPRQSGAGGDLFPTPGVASQFAFVSFCSPWIKMGSLQPTKSS